jgi:hypothetical protein
MDVWSFEERFGQGGHVLEPIRMSWPKVPRGGLRFEKKEVGDKKEDLHRSRWSPAPNHAGTRSRWSLAGGWPAVVCRCPTVARLRPQVAQQQGDLPGDRAAQSVSRQTALLSLPPQFAIFWLFGHNFLPKFSITFHKILQVACMHPQLTYGCKIRSAHNLIWTNFEIMGGCATNANSNSRVAICHNVHHAHDLIMLTYFLHKSLHNHTTNLQCKGEK